MKVVLFCGGLGTRLRAHSETIPKPLAEIGGRPIVWHLMKYYASFGHKDFILCLGYRGDLIREYFLNYNPYLSTDFVMTDGGQTLKPSKNDIDDDEYFLANYSDQLSDLPLDEFISDGKSKGSVAARCSSGATA